MNGDEDPQSVRRIEDGAAIGADGDGAAHEPLRRRRAEGDDKPWPYDLDLVEQPPPAYLDLAGVGAFVQSPLAPRLKLEMLDRVGHVNAGAVDARFHERPVQQKPRRPDKRATFPVFAIPGLLADQHDRSVRRPLS